MKTFKEFIKEEGYDIARDMGKVRPSKDKKDATSYPPSEEMEKLRKVNKGPSALERVKADIRKRGEKIMGEAKVDMGKDDAAKRNERNQRTFGNRRDSKGSMASTDDTEARRYNTAKGRGVKIRGKKDKTPVNYHKRDSEKRVDALLKSMRESMSGGVPMTPQELNIQKKMSQLNVRLARKRSQQLQKAKVQDTETSPEQVKEEGLRAWFGKSSGTTKSGRKVKGWVQVGGKYDGKPCARQPGQKTTPKCVSSSKRRSMSDKERDSAARRKRAADPGQPKDWCSKTNHGINRSEKVMPAVSKKQQQFFGIVRAIQKGEQAPTTPETAKAAADMKKSDVKKFASTKHKGLPNKVVQKEALDTDDKPFLKKLAGKLRKGSKTHAKQADDIEKAMKEEKHGDHEPETIRSR